MPNDIEIDPAEVVQDEVKIDPAEVVQDPGPKNYSLTRADTKLIQAGFGDDPLGFIADEDRRTYCRSITDKMQDPEGTRKRMALAAYFTRYNSGANYEFIFANMDSILEKHFGKATTVEQAWDKFREMYNPKGPENVFDRKINAVVDTADTIVHDVPHVVAAVGAGLAKTALNVLNVALKMAAAPSMEERAARQLALTPQEREAVENADREFAAGVDNLARPWRKALTEAQEKHTRAALPDENWFTNFNSEWGYNALKFLMIQAPQQAAQLALAYHMGPAAFCLAIGGSSAVDKWYDLEDTPGMTDRQKFLNAAFTGFINSGSAWITAGVVKGKIPALNRETIAKGARGAIGYFLKAFGVEAGQEAVEQLAENITDIYTGVHGDPSKMDRATFTKLLFNGVGESALAGGVFGTTAAGLGFKSWHDRMALAESIRRQAETTAAALEKKGGLTPQERTRLDAARAVASQNEPDKVFAADMLARLAEANNSDEAIRKSERFRILREAADPEVPDETVIEAVRSERARALSRELPHNPQDTADAALELMTRFPQFKLEVYDTIDSVPEEVKKAMEEQTETPSLVRAWTDDAGVVHLIADRVRPDQAAKVVGHEIIGHHGLRAVLGDNFDAFLDDVYKLHASEIEAYADRYQADPESEEGRRYLTEEFLADCADANVKPSWWKEFLARCREFLDRVFGQHHFSDRDIEAALSRSARAVRRKRGLAFDRENDGVRFAFADSDGNIVQEFGVRNTQLDDNTPLNTISVNTENYASTAATPDEVRSHHLRTADADAELRRRVDKHKGEYTVFNDDSQMMARIGKNDSREIRHNFKYSSTPGYVYAAAMVNIEPLFRKAKLCLSHDDKYAVDSNGVVDPNTDIEQMHRFFVVMEYEGKQYAVKLTVKEWKDGNNSVYSLETHETEISEIKTAPADNTSTGGGGSSAKADSPEFTLGQIKQLFNLPRNYHSATNITVISEKSRLDAEKNARFLKEKRNTLTCTEKEPKKHHPYKTRN